jgi:hypothetical protein
LPDWALELPEVWLVLVSLIGALPGVAGHASLKPPIVGFLGRAWPPNRCFSGLFCASFLIVYLRVTKVRIAGDSARRRDVGDVGSVEEGNPTPISEVVETARLIRRASTLGDIDVQSLDIHPSFGGGAGSGLRAG